MSCFFLLEKGFKEAYVYTFVDVVTLYYSGAICKYVCDFVGSSFGSIQISYYAFNFYEDLVTNGAIIKHTLLTFL